MKTVQRLKSAEADLLKREHEPVRVAVNLHAAVPSNATDDHVSEKQLHKQFDVLKQEYEKYGVHMSLGNITRNKDNSLTKMKMDFDDEGDLNGSTPEIEAYWKERRTGDYKTLNIFIYEQIVGALGVCNFPEEDRPRDEYYLDACHIVADSLPDSGSQGVWNAGGVAVHETGHWFGLFHVWSDECDDEGDLVADTPQQKMPSMAGCSDPDKDSCPDKPGNDNSHNFMDYSGDECVTEFTSGQRARMHNMYHSIRSKK